MAKRSTSKHTYLSDLDNEELPDDETEEEPVLEETDNVPYNDRVKLRLIIGVKSFSTDGPVTGEHYKWLGAGSVLEVDERDVAGLISKRLGNKVCCGGDENSNRIFEIVKEI